MKLFSFDELMGYAKKRAVRELREAFEEFSMEEILELESNQVGVSESLETGSLLIGFFLV